MWKGHKLKANKGQSIVETAIILPIALLLLTGIIDFGLLFNNYLIIANASREGARLAAVGMSDTRVQATVMNITSSLDISKITVTIHPSELSRKKGDEIKVTVGYDNQMFTPIISGIIPNPLHIEEKTIMRME